MFSASDLPNDHGPHRPKGPVRAVVFPFFSRLHILFRVILFTGTFLPLFPAPTRAGVVALPKKGFALSGVPFPFKCLAEINSACAILRCAPNLRTFRCGSLSLPSAASPPAYISSSEWYSLQVHFFHFFPLPQGQGSLRSPKRASPFPGSPFPLNAWQK